MEWAVNNHTWILAELEKKKEEEVNEKEKEEEEEVNEKAKEEEVNEKEKDIEKDTEKEKDEGRDKERDENEEENSIQTLLNEENAFNNVLLPFSSDEDQSDESLVPFYHENSIANNHLNGSVSHTEFGPINTTSGSAVLSVTSAIICSLMCLLFNLRWSYTHNLLLISL